MIRVAFDIGARLPYANTIVQYRDTPLQHRAA